MDIRSVLRRLWNATVWSKSGVPDKDRRYRGQFRFAFPLFDLFLCYFGAVGWAKGIVSVQQATGHGYATSWSATLAVSALGALIGVSFPQLWWFELISKIVLVGTVFLYVAIYSARIVSDFNASAAAGLVLALILFPLWRVADLSVIAWKHGLGRKRAKR